MYMRLKYMLRLIFTPSLIIVWAVIGLAQNTQRTTKGWLVGRVTERITGKPVERARVSIGGLDDSFTDTTGAFRLELPAGTYTIRVSAEGYAPVIIIGITITDSRTTINDVRLDVFLSEKVDVSGGYFPENENLTVTNVELTRAEIRSTPGTGGDVLRVLDNLPGVTNTSGEFADLIVRGGNVGENLTFIDNVPVADFTYFTDEYDQGRGGRISVLAPDTIERLEFSAGGFGVRYGDRMSSALDITLRKAARDRVQGVAFLDSGAFGGTVEVPLGRRGGWLFSARRSYVDIAFDIFNIGEIGRPRNFDFTNKIDYDINPRHKVSFTALNLFERFTINLDEAFDIDRRVDQLVTDRSGRRLIVGLTLSSTFGRKTFSQLTVWSSGQHSDATFRRTFNFSFAGPTLRLFLDGETVQRQRDLRDSEVGVKEELVAQPASRLSLAAGGGLVIQRANYFTFERAPLGFSPIEEEFLAPTRSNRLVINTTAGGYSYLQATLKPVWRFSLTPSVRVDRYSITDETLISPRVSTRLVLTPRVSFNAAAGIYRQPPDLFILSLAPENRALKTQRAVHTIIGLEWLARDDVRISIEAYRKSYHNLLVRPTLTSPLYFNTGEGEACGLDLVAQKALSDRFGGEAIYSFTHSRRRFTPGSFSFPSGTERPHQLTLIGITKLKGFTLAGKLRVASGLPFNIYTPVEVRPGIFLQRLARVEDRNAARLPAYAQLDVRVEKRFSFRRWSFAPYTDVFNVLGRINNTEQDYSYLDPLPRRLGEARTLPLFGARVEF